MMEAQGININGKAAKRITLGGNVLWEQCAGLPEGLVCWYDLERQGATYKKLSNSPTLTDFSGNGNDLPLTSVSQGDGFIKYSSSPLQGLSFTDFCVICKWPFRSGSWSRSYVKMNGRDSSVPGAIFGFEGSSSYTAYSFGRVMATVSAADFASHIGNERVLVQTPTNFSIYGYSTFAGQRGGSVDYSDGGFLNVCNCSKFMLFDRSLPEETINEIIAKFFN